jgi:serine/threonine protein kinase
MDRPQTFGRYQLLQVAGAGGMAQVHLARQLGPAGFVKPCVVKRIADVHRGNDLVRRMFLEEARVSALLNHPNVVQTFDYGEVEGTPFMALELVDGVNLAQLCRSLAQNDRWLPLQPALEIVRQILEALEYAHRLTDLAGNALHLVHRDVSPQNVLLSRQGTVKLADFGIARHDAREALTIGPNAKGKPGYMSPEQAMGGEVDARADLFAVGVILAELISARRVLPSKDRVTSVLEIEARVRTLCALRREAPPELAELAVRMAALKPEHRPQSAREAIELLRRASGRVPPSLPLQDFLRSVFDTYLQDVLPSAASRDIPVPAPHADLATDLDAPPDPALTSPPEASASGLQFEQGAWDKSADPPTGTQAIYEDGWPAQYKPESRGGLKLAPAGPAPTAPEEMEVVAHSSSVDVMDYFRPQVSEEAARRGRAEGEAEAEEATRAKERRLPYIVGARQSAERPDLPPPTFSDEPAKRGMLGFEDPGLKKALATIADDGTPQAKAAAGAPGGGGRRIPPVLYLLGAGVVVSAAAFGILAALSGERTAPPPPPPGAGEVEVTSDPPGAEILLDGVPTKKRTPATLTGLALDRVLRLSVHREGYLTTPPDVPIRVTQAALHTSANFILQRGRAFKLLTEPPDATVTVNDHRIAALTPLTLPVIPYGASATVTLQLEGYMPQVVVLHARAETATVVQVALRVGKAIEITSDPPGARVSLDGRPIGRTPIYDLLVPAEDRFWVKVSHKGFKPWKRRFSGKTVGEAPLVAELAPLPFLALPWEKEEKARARDLDRQVNLQRQKVERQKATLRKAEGRQAQVEGSINASVGELAEVQRRTDLARDAVSEAENALVELEAQMDSMREQLLLRMDEE